MNKLWRRASGRIKDRNSLLMASLTRRSRYRDPDLEVAMIRATSHDDTFVDYKNAQRVFTWVRTSPTHLTIVLWALTRRVERTTDWIVALKSLILLHGVLCTKVPGTRKIGRLPFELLGFDDGYTQDGPRRWARNMFVRAYFGFVDLKSVVLATELKEEIVGPMVVVEEQDGGGSRLQLVRVQRWQDLLCSVLQVRPEGKGMMDDVLVMEAMDCMIIEVFELYSKICDGIATALMKIYTDKVGKEEAAMALDVLQKATKQGHDLSEYFAFCRRFGLLHASECPKIETIPEADFVELQRIINGPEVVTDFDNSSNCQGALVVVGERKEIDVVQERNKPWLKTVITNQWEIFDEDINKPGNGNGNAGVIIDPFAASYNFPPVLQFNPFVDYGSTPSQLVLA